jgi:UDP-N-acetylglucosamine:LPS N-acetylglucosamine transferase
VFSSRGAAILVNNSELNTDKAAELVSSILQSPENLKTMANQMRPLAKPDAAADLLNLMEQNLDV